MNMRKAVLTIFFATLISFVSITDVWALEIDTSKVCSLTGLYSFGEQKLGGANVYLYKLADVSDSDANVKYNYTADFKSFDKDINNYTSSSWGDYAVEVAEYIHDKKIKAIISSVTDTTGKYLFNRLTTGLYLVIIDSVEDDNYRYNASPSLVSIPNYNMVTGQYMYDISVVMKTEATSIKQPDNPNNDNKTDVPYTYDAITKYVIVFVVALLVLVITVCYINKKRKDVKKNEKNNEKIS